MSLVLLAQQSRAAYALKDECQTQKKGPRGSHLSGNMTICQGVDSSDIHGKPIWSHRLDRLLWLDLVPISFAPAFLHVMTCKIPCV